jgi:hypothetical protein
MDTFDIIEYLSGITQFVFDKAVLKRIAYDRDVVNVTDYEELDDRTKDLLRADLLYTAYMSPNVWASSTNSHGSYTKSIGSQTIYAEEKERLYNTFVSIYKKYDDPILDQVEELGGDLQWL